MNTPPVSWNVQTPHLHRGACKVTMEAQAANLKTTTNSQYIAMSDHIQSTTLKIKNPLDTSRCDKGHACTEIEIPQTDCAAQAPRMVASNLVEESDLESVDISSDNESDGWSIISDRSDFVVVDSAGTTHQSSDARSRKRSVVPKRISKLRDRVRSSGIRPRKMIPSQKEQEVPEMKPAMDAGSQGVDEHTQKLAAPQATPNVIDELIERLTEQARALKL